MKVLLIGGTGTISSAVAALAAKKGFELWLLNRGSRPELVPENARAIACDIRDEAAVRAALGGMSFDVAADFIAFSPADAERDFRLFGGRVGQYIFISSASAYQKPPDSPFLTENTPLENPFWDYSRKKIACEKFLMQKFREQAFPVTIVRPSHTYGDFAVPVALHGKNGSFAVLERIRRHKKVIVPGDGTSLWTVTHNTDFANAFVGLMGNPDAIGQAYQITSDEVYSWNRIYQSIGAALGVEPLIVHIPSDVLARVSERFRGGLLGDKTHSVIFDNRKIKQAVPGFTAMVRLDQGIRRSVAYIYSHEECRRPDPEFDAWCDRTITLYENLTAGLPAYDG